MGMGGYSSDCRCTVHRLDLPDNLDVLIFLLRVEPGLSLSVSLRHPLRSATCGRAHNSVDKGC